MDSIGSFLMGIAVTCIFVIILMAYIFWIDSRNRTKEEKWDDEYFQKGYEYYPNETNIPIIRIYDDYRAKSFMKGYTKAYRENIEKKMVGMLNYKGDEQ